MNHYCLLHDYRHHYPHRIPYCTIDESTTSLEINQSIIKELNFHELTERESNVLAVMKDFGALTIDHISCHLYMREAALFNDELLAVLVGLVNRGVLEAHYINSTNGNTVFLTLSAAWQHFHGEQQPTFFHASLQEITDHLECVSFATELINRNLKQNRNFKQIAYASFYGQCVEIAFHSGNRICYIPCQRSIRGWQDSLLEKAESIKALLCKRSNMTFVLGCESSDHMFEMDRILGGRIPKEPFFLQKQHLLEGSLVLTRLNKVHPFPKEEE